MWLVFYQIDSSQKPLGDGVQVLSFRTVEKVFISQQKDEITIFV